MYQTLPFRNVKLPDMHSLISQLKEHPESITTSEPMRRGVGIRANFIVDLLKNLLTL